MDDFVTYARDCEYPKGRDIPWVSYLSGKEGLNCFYSIHWNDVKEREPEKPIRTVGHPPHMHKETEMIFLIGMDPENHFDLGAEVEMCIGEDMKKYVLTESCTLRIPPNTPHGFYNIVECKRPFLFVQVQEANPPTEKFLWDYLTPEEIASIPEHSMKFWVDKGYDE